MMTSSSCFFMVASVVSNHGRPNTIEGKNATGDFQISTRLRRVRGKGVKEISGKFWQDGNRLHPFWLPVDRRCSRGTELSLVDC
jgi:hypothetical protein